MGRPTQSPPSSDSADYRSLADAFYDIYEEMFTSRLPTSAFSVALQSYMRDKAPYLVYGPEDLGEQKPCTPAVYDGLMPMLVQNLLDTCKFQYSVLGKGHQDMEKKPTYLTIALSRDDESLPFDTSAAHLVQEIRLESAEVASLSQTWFASHPLACCVSIADVHGEGPLHKALLSIVACEASILSGLPRSEELLDQAHKIFFSTRLPDKDDVESLLLACQISTLLGWRHTAYTRVKWGIANLALACQLMAQIESRPERQGAILSNLKSFLSIITVWAFSQLDRSSGSLSVGDDPKASPLLQFYSRTAQMTSLLLNVHPNVHGISMVKVQHGDFNVLCQQLLASLSALGGEYKSDAKGRALVQAVQHILNLYLLLPRTKSHGYDFPQRANGILARCNAAQLLLLELGNEKANSQDAVPMLNKLAFHRKDQVKSDMMAMNCTVAAILFTTVVEALQALSQMQANGIYSTAIVEISRKVLETPMSLVVQTDTIMQNREILSTLSRRDSNAGSILSNDSIKWLDSMLPTTSSSTYDTPIEQTDSEPDLIDCLWGQLQWNVPFDIPFSTDIDVLSNQT
jgi:hypothetical protein